MFLPLILVIRVALFPDMVPIHYMRFESESECRVAAIALDKRTNVILLLSCEVDI